MSSDRRSARLRRTALEAPGLRTLRRPATDAGPAFDLAYTRTGPRSAVPVVVLPGGPGLASVLPYRRFRARARKLGIDTLMIEHRGIGLSRSDIDGNDLPVAAITVEAVISDIAAILDHEEIDAAVVYGSSYGTYLACGFGITHPNRVAGLVLDSTVMSAHDHHVVRAHARSLLWDGDEPALADCARMLRDLVDGGVDQDEACDVVRKVYEFGGPALLRRLLALARTGDARRTWTFVAQLGRSEAADDTAMPYWMEFGPVSAIAFTELNYAPPPNGQPFDPAPQFVDIASKYPPFASEPFDIATHMPDFQWPTAIISGTRDLRTPRPVAVSADSLIPNAHLVTIDSGHSALDTHQLVALHVIERMTGGQAARLTTASDSSKIQSFAVRGSPTRFLPHLIATTLAWDTAVGALRRRLRTVVSRNRR
ncbi:alpha/beta fold hydrolase [Rhodococcus sovatensis]|uniref:Alpha/beta fold hydrolase n=1 Tax=Rhodococcus sovatensis TaxID=1805840 RepID=A0ABZ2PKK3_9NOCA